MLRIYLRTENIILEYQPQNGTSWIEQYLADDGEVCIIKGHFTFQRRHLNIQSDQYTLISDSNTAYFLLGRLVGDYYLIEKKILGIKNDLLLHKDLKIDNKTFLIDQNKYSIFKEIDMLVDEQIVIGGEMENNIPIVEFIRLLKLFPTRTTLFLYGKSRITGILKDYLGTTIDAQKKLETHLLEKGKLADRIRLIPGRIETVGKLLKEYEFEKYQFILTRVEYMLDHPGEYTEKEWQKIIIEFIILIFPKYIAVLENVKIIDQYSRLGELTHRYIDLALIDANGNIDIIEIKKPFENCILYRTPYRDNYIPKKELSGTVMQIEKYLLHLNKEGTAGEKRIQNEKESSIPNGIQIKITNPKGIIILGRDTDFESEHRFDFEIVKRQYSKIIDIMTYDDLLQRLKTIMSKFEVTNG